MEETIVADNYAISLWICSAPKRPNTVAQNDACGGDAFRREVDLTIRMRCHCVGRSPRRRRHSRRSPRSVTTLEETEDAPRGAHGSEHPLTRRVEFVPDARGAPVPEGDAGPSAPSAPLRDDAAGGA